jgi:protease IV
LNARQFGGRFLFVAAFRHLRIRSIEHFFFKNVLHVACAFFTKKHNTLVINYLPNSHHTMSNFFKYLFASCLGTALALGLLVFVVFGAIASLAGSASEDQKVAVRPNTVLELKFDTSIPEKTNNLEVDPFDTEHPYVLGVSDIVKTIRKAKEDPDIKGIYLSPQALMAGKASAKTIRDAILDFKTSGKFVVAYSHFYTQSGYYMASAADSVLLNPVGLIEFKGYASQVTFFKEMLDKLDLEMRIFYAGQFKSATEPFRLDKMSDQNRLQVREYVNALYDIFITDIAASRGVSPADLRATADRYDGRTATLALQNRLVDRIAHEDEVFGLMKAKIGLDSDDKLNRVSLEDYYVAKGKLADTGSSKDKIAVVYAEGNISDGTQAEVGAITDGQYVRILRKIRQDDNIKAIVLRINSGGGSVLASENIFREVMLCKQAGKPVVVSMGDVAASGGYYIGCQADSIFCEPGTITGSIGVFGLVPILQKMMKNKLGITVDTVLTARNSAFGTPFLDFSPEQQAMMQARVEATYEDFLQKVATGRHMTRDQVHTIAQGRVWPGHKAKEIGLVDDLGGLDRAIASAAKLANLEKYRTSEFPRTKTGIEQFVDQFVKKKERDEAISNAVMRSQLGDMYPLYRSFQEMREASGLQARVPFQVVIW